MSIEVYMKILGQEKLLSKINSYTYQTYPKSVILLGAFGSGKHLMSSYIADRFKLELIDITEQISQEFINNISARVTPSLYVIDASKIDDRKQNMILKFLEEPSEYSFIIILAEDRVNLLPTIMNRCIIFEVEQYSRSVLEQFVDSSVDKELALSVCPTPGQLKALTLVNLSDLHVLCTKMVQKTSIASYPNTLSISDKLNYKDEFNKFDVELFFNMLTHVMLNEFKTTNDKKILILYNITVEYVKKMRNKRLNRKHLVENYLSALWQGVRTQ